MSYHLSVPLQHLLLLLPLRVLGVPAPVIAMWPVVSSAILGPIYQWLCSIVNFQCTVWEPQLQTQFICHCPTTGLVDMSTGTSHEGLRGIKWTNPQNNVEFTPPKLIILLKMVTGADEIFRFSNFSPNAHGVRMCFTSFSSISGYRYFQYWFWVGPCTLPVSPSHVLRVKMCSYNICDGK